MDLGWQQASTNQYAFNDGWLRTYRGVPDMNNGVKKMLQDYIKNGEHNKVILFFVEKCGYDGEYSAFLLRELM